MNDRYSSYITSEVWEIQRQAAFGRWGSFCNVCGSLHGIDVHHLFYRKLYNCIPEDLMPLCRDCHDKIHEKTHLPYSLTEQGDHFEKRMLTIRYVAEVNEKYRIRNGISQHSPKPKKKVTIPKRRIYFDPLKHSYLAAHLDRA